MIEGLQQARPLSNNPERYSKSIPPERKGKPSGVFKIDVTKFREIKSTYDRIKKIPGEKRKEWIIGGTLLKAFNEWKVLPPDITEHDCEERREILDFIGGKNNEKGTYGSLPSIKAIAIELARLVLGTIPEWYILDRVVQFTIEAELAKFIGQEHPEFPDYRIPDIRREKLLSVIGTEHNTERKPVDFDEQTEKARQEVIKKLTDKIIELAAQIENEEETDHTSLEPTVLVDISTLADKTSRKTQMAMLPPRDRYDQTTPRIEPPARPNVLKGSFGTKKGDGNKR